MKQILVPLDGSDLSETALPFAEALARSANATVILMRGILTYPRRFRGAGEFNRKVRKEATDYLEALVEQVQGRGVLGCSLVVEDEAGYAILQAAAQQAPDLIIMSTHGRGALGRAIWGSIADRVLRSAPVPVLLVPRGVEAGWEDVETPTLVLPLDGSAHAEAAIDPATELATALGARVILVQSIDPLPLLAGPDAWVVYEAYGTQFAEQKEAATKYLESVATRLHARGVATTVLATDGAAASVIQNVARANHAHAVVMATHGRGGALRFLMGSTAEALVHSGSVPIVLVRPPAAGAQTTTPPPETHEVERAQELSVTAEQTDLLEDALQYWIRGNHSGEGLVAAFDLLARIEALRRTAPSAAQSSDADAEAPAA